MIAYVRPGFVSAAPLSVPAPPQLLVELEFELPRAPQTLGTADVARDLCQFLQQRLEAVQPRAVLCQPRVAAGQPAVRPDRSDAGGSRTGRSDADGAITSATGWRSRAGASSTDLRQGAGNWAISRFRSSTRKGPYKRSTGRRPLSGGEEIHRLSGRLSNAGSAAARLGGKRRILDLRPSRLGATSAFQIPP